MATGKRNHEVASVIQIPQTSAGGLWFLSNTQDDIKLIADINWAPGDWWWCFVCV